MAVKLTTVLAKESSYLYQDMLEQRRRTTSARLWTDRQWLWTTTEHISSHWPSDYERSM